jgi:hypothetical protein
MSLTPAQAATVKADILATPELNAFANNTDGAFAIAALYNLAASPAFYVWKTSLSEQSITSEVSPEATSWNWSAYIARTQGERDGWNRIFGFNGACNPSLPNVRQAFADIFSGSSNSAPAQRTHITATAKRTANRIEKLLATGTGSLAVPATMGFVGDVSYQDINEARNS